MSALGRLLAAGAVAASACVPVPAYEPELAVSLVENADGITISAPAFTTPGFTTTPGFALETVSTSKFPYPSRLLVGAVNVLGHDLAAACHANDEIGISLRPMPRVSAHGPAPAPRAYTVQTLFGPAAAQYTVFWESTFCMTSHAPAAMSVFTAFPDGRIVRYDQVLNQASEPFPVFMCDCSNTDISNFRAQSFWTFTTQTSPRPALHLSTLPTGDTEVPNPDYDCLAYDGYEVAVSWPLRRGADLRGTSIKAPTPETLAFSDELDNRLGANDVGPFDLNSTSVLVVSNTGCTGALARARATTEPAQYKLFINNEELLPTPQNGIYGSDVENTGGYRSITNTIALTGTAPELFAVWINFPGEVDAIRATKQGGTATGAWYIPQKAAGGWIIWFRDALRASETITIEPR